MRISDSSLAKTNRLINNHELLDNKPEEPIQTTCRLAFPKSFACPVTGKSKICTFGSQGFPGFKLKLEVVFNRLEPQDRQLERDLSLSVCP